MPTPDEDLLITKRKVAPYYWPDAQTMMQLFLSVSAVGLVWYVVQRLLAEGGLKIDASVRDLVVFILGIIFGCFKDVYGYTFGSSAGQKRQGEVITKSLEDKDKIIAGNVAATAASLPPDPTLHPTTSPVPTTTADGVTLQDVADAVRPTETKP